MARKTVIAQQATTGSPNTARAELREKVARAIYDTLEGPVANQDFGRQIRQWEQSLSLADAAIAVALEEAARVATEYRHPNLALYTHQVGINAAIRALISPAAEGQSQSNG